ncbi:hypothetical protein ACIFOE_12920 [Paenibacillus sp. NRS-1783]|uniref:hypothetical protein n=1 Tax=Paenibacillus sp. NRS-1783 TaxID=3233907 RepID=UPI003D2B4059
MIVKIGEQFFDSYDEPILLILNKNEKALIGDMGEQKVYCSFPTDCEPEEIAKWMKIPEELLEAVDYLEWEE